MNPVATAEALIKTVLETVESWRNLFQTSGRVMHLCPQCGEKKVPLQDWNFLILTCPDCRNEIPWRDQ